MLLVDHPSHLAQNGLLLVRLQIKHHETAKNDPWSLESNPHHTCYPFFRGLNAFSDDKILTTVLSTP